MALRRSVLPGAARRRRRRPRSRPRRPRPGRACAPHVCGHRPRRRRHPRAERPVPARGEIPARVLHRHGPRGRRAGARQRREQHVLDGHDAPRARPWQLRRRHRRLAALAPAHDPPDPERGHRDALRTAREGSRVAQASRRPGRERARAHRRPAPCRAGRGAARLRALGSRRDDVRARFLRRSRRRPRFPLVGTGPALPARQRPRTIDARPTGRPRSTSPSRRSITRTTSTGR